MKLLVCGARTCSGLAKNGNSFSFSELNVLTPIQPFNSEKFNVSGYKGFEVSQIPCTPEVVRDLVNMSQPVNLEFEVAHEMKNGSLVAVVCGIKK